MGEARGFRDYVAWLERVRRTAAALRERDSTTPGIAPPDPGVPGTVAGGSVSGGGRTSPHAVAEPLVSVVTPARNVGPWVAEAVASVLLQEGVTLEQIVVDDASTDDTAAVVEGVDDPRVRLLRNSAHRGIGHSHNRALEVARGRFVVHLDADDVLLRGALRAVTGALRERPDAAYAWAWHVEADAACRVGEAEFRRQRDFRAAQERFHPDVRRALLVHGMITNPLRTYRREVFDVVGPFDEDLPWAVDFDMAVRVADRFHGVRVPRVLYVQRVHGGNVQQGKGFRALRSWGMRARICRRRLRNEGTLLGRRAPGVYALQAAGLAHALGLPRLARRVVPFRRRAGAAGRIAVGG